MRLFGPPAERYRWQHGMVNFTGLNQFRDVRFRNVRVQFMPRVTINLLYLQVWHGRQIMRKQLVDLWPNCVGGVFTLLQTGHRHDTTGVNHRVRNAYFGWNACVVLARHECRIVVRDDRGGIFRQLIEKIVGIAPALAQIKQIPDTPFFQFSFRIRHSFQKKAVEAIAGKWIRARDALVEQNRQIMFVRQRYRVGQSMIALRTPVHLSPVQDVLGALRSAANGSIVQFFYSILHSLSMPAGPVSIQ